MQDSNSVNRHCSRPSKQYTESQFITCRARSYGFFSWSVNRTQGVLSSFTFRLLRSLTVKCLSATTEFFANQSTQWHCTLRLTFKQRVLLTNSVTISLEHSEACKDLFHFLLSCADVVPNSRKLPSCIVYSYDLSQKNNTSTHVSLRVRKDSTFLIGLFTKQL